jgi:XTP/dITP diphosphohydrolase
MKILLATNNRGKIERFKKLINHIDSNIEVFYPNELGIEIINVEENGKTLMENALLKANAYLGKVDFPILSNDTGFYVEGDGFVDAPKRKALEGINESELSEEEISKRLLNFWKGVATKHGGRVDSAWVEAWVLLLSNGEVKKVESRREIVLTNQEFGTPHIHMPVRALYYSKITNKPAVLHTEEDEIREMKPVIEALKKILK